MPRVFLLLSAGGPTGAEMLARTALAARPDVPHDAAVADLRHAFDFGASSHLRDRIAVFGPDVLHAVGAGAVRAATLLMLPRVGLRPFPRFVVSGCDAPDGWLARRGLVRADAVLAYTPGQEQRYQRYVKSERIRRVPLGVMASRVGEPAGSSVPPDPSQGRLARTIAAVGNFDRNSGLRTAVWAFDVLKYVAPDFQLRLIGDGPNRAAVDEFGRALGFDDYRVSFTGCRNDVPGLLETAAVTWVTHDRGGIVTVLESLSVGTPVVAFRTSDTETVIDDGETGRLVPFGDRVALASTTAELLNQSGELCRLGERGRRVVAERWPSGPLAEATALAYAGR